MSFLFPSAPAPPPPPPNPSNLATQSISEQGAAQASALANANGAGYDGTDVTGGKGAKDPTTTANASSGMKSLLGS